jgi:hypothetical protein
MAHVGRPCDPPFIGTPSGNVAFEPNADGGPLWLGPCTQEQFDYLSAFPHFKAFQEDAQIPQITKGVIPDATWTRAGIAEWAKEELDVVIDMKLKADMLTELHDAITAVVARAEAEATEKSSLPPFVAEVSDEVASDLLPPVTE